MTKLLVVLLVVGVALWALLGRVRAGRRTRVPPGSPASGQAAPREEREGSEEMVRCAHCGVHLPGSDAVQSGRHRYCSAEHATSGPRHG